MKGRNFSLIIIGYGLTSLSMMLLLLFFQTMGSFWLITGSVSLVGAIWVIRKERKDRKTDMMASESSDMAFTKCVKCGEMRFDKHVNRCGNCGSEGFQG
ncbi:hypothetical protein OAQ30_02525 [Nitrosopumilus sp.]|nr:hypothetical protein [Nitrosopumilus sp.]